MEQINAEIKEIQAHRYNEKSPEHFIIIAEGVHPRTNQ